MESKNSLENYIFIILYLFLLFINVSGKSMESGCGDILVNYPKDSGLQSFRLSEISGKNLESFTLLHLTISSIIVKPGWLFRLCGYDFCKIFDENDKEIVDKLRDLDHITVSAECYRSKETIPKNKSCSELSSELLQTNECVRFYRSPSCNGRLPYISKENEEKTFNFENEIFESLAVRDECKVEMTHNYGVETLSSQDDLFSFYKNFNYTHPKDIHFKCIC